MFTEVAMVLDNLQVRHKAFGLGTVISTNGKYMTIQFEAGVKNFVYPDSFEKYLTLADGTVTDEIRADLERVNEERRRIEETKIAENRHSMEHGIVIPGKETSLEGDDEDSQYKSQETE